VGKIAFRPNNRIFKLRCESQFGFDGIIEAFADFAHGGRWNKFEGSSSTTDQTTATGSRPVIMFSFEILTVCAANNSASISVQVIW